MFRTTLATGCVAIATFATAAFADVTVVVSSGGYDDFFERCKLDIEMQRSGAVADSTVIYRLAAGEKGASMCAKEDYSSGCNGELEKYTCEEVTGIDVYGMVCVDSNGARVDCGKISAKKGSGMSAPVNLVPNMPKADTVLFGSLAGYDDFFDRCDLAFMFSADPSIRRMDLELEVAHSGGTAQCGWNFSTQGSSGSGCTGESEFQCDAVSQIVIKKLSCHDNDNELDCGSIAFGSAEAGLLVDGR